MLEIEDIKVADLNKGEEPLPNGNRYGDYISLVQQVNAAVYEIKTISKELHEVNKSLKLIAGRMR